MLGVFPKDAKGLKASILLMVVGRVGYVGLDLRAGPSRTADGSNDTGVYCMSSWATA